MTKEKNPLFEKASDVYCSTFKLAEGYTLETKISKFITVENNNCEYNMKIVKNNILVTHTFVTTDFDIYSKVWEEFYETIRVESFTEELAESLGFIKEKGKV